MRQKLTQLLQEVQKEQNLNEAAFILTNMAFHGLAMLANTYFTASRDYEKAVMLSKMAACLDDKSWSLFNNLAHFHNQAGYLAEASEAAERATQLCKRTAGDPYYNAGVIYRNAGNFHKAIENYRIAKELLQPPTMASYNLATVLLLTREFEEGWKEYESRLNVPEVQQIIQRFFQPYWKGEDFKTLFVFNEQGIGDLIQFIRYLPEVKKRGGHIVLEHQAELTELLAFNSHLGFDELRPVDLAQTDADFVCSISSLPGIFAADFASIDNSPYIFAPNTELETQKTKIGIVWAGGTIHAQDHLRSCPLRHFEKISRLDHVQLFSLQKELRLLEGSEQVNVTRLPLSNFLETASHILALDLVIAVDTAVAHLAGAMGKPVWLLVPYVNDWRWFDKIDYSPWYSKMKIFRQDESRSWDSVFERMICRLSAKTAPHIG